MSEALPPYNEGNAGCDPPLMPSGDRSGDEENGRGHPCGWLCRLCCYRDPVELPYRPASVVNIIDDVSADVILNLD